MKMFFVETRPFTARMKTRLSEEEYRKLQTALLQNPDAGAIMPGCGGLRKLRWGEQGRGRGKRGGSRVIYLHIPELHRIDLITIYSKGEQEDLSPDEKRYLTLLATWTREEATRRMRRRKKR